MTPTKERGRIVIADDEEAARRSLGQILREDGFEVSLAANGEEALQLVARESPDVLLTDLRMPGLDGIELLRRVCQAYPEVSVVIMTAHGTIRSAVQALHDGAEDYLTKPVDVEEMEHLLDRIMIRKRLLSETRMLRERLDDKYGFENIIGRSAGMLHVFGLVEQVAPSQASILITGESGTGKELIAQAIHQRSPRREAPFVKVSCAALPETLLESELFGHERGAFTGALSRRAGRFEMAAGGTIFLDEIGDVPAAMQVKLLRFLQERQFERLGGNQTLTVDVRIVAATHRDLRSLIRQGTFREDLYYRLNVVNVCVPPLRERKEEIPVLVDHFLHLYSAKYGRQRNAISDGLMKGFLAYGWPGNVRELENMLKRIVVLQSEDAIADEIFGAPTQSAQAEPSAPEANEPVSVDAGSAQVSLRDIGRRAARDAEREALKRVLNQTNWNRKKAARILEVSYKTLLQKIKECGLGE